MRIIDKYILKKMLTAFFFVVLVLVAVIVVIDVTEKMDKFARNNLSFYIILGYYRDFIPWIAGLLTPITVFIATVFVTSRMAAHTEIIAILSSGTSFRRLLFPYFIGASIIAGISFILNGWVIPQSNRSRLSFELKYFENRTSFDKRNVHMQVAPDVYLFLQNFSNLNSTGYMFTLEKFEDGRLVEKLTADNIRWDTAINKWHLRNWKKRHVESIFEGTAQNKSELTERGAAMDTALSITPKDFANEGRQYDGMTIPELNEQIEKMRFRGSTNVEDYETEKYLRYSAPFTTFVLVFMGVIVSSKKIRGGTGFQIALGFLLSFAFILFFLLARTFAEAGSLSPLVAAWIPNISFALISLGMYKYVPR